MTFAERSRGKNESLDGFREGKKRGKWLTNSVGKEGKNESLDGFRVGKKRGKWRTNSVGKGISKWGGTLQDDTCGEKEKEVTNSRRKFWGPKIFQTAVDGKGLMLLPLSIREKYISSRGEKNESLDGFREGKKRGKWLTNSVGEGISKWHGALKDDTYGEKEKEVMNSCRGKFWGPKIFQTAVDGKRIDVTSVMYPGEIYLVNLMASNSNQRWEVFKNRNRERRIPCGEKEKEVINSRGENFGDRKFSRLRLMGKGLMLLPLIELEPSSYYNKRISGRSFMLLIAKSSHQQYLISLLGVLVPRNPLLNSLSMNGGRTRTQTSCPSPPNYPRANKPNGPLM
ncbi:hypothetical protein CEXT_507681 [Caerostris extrusa]|uniref:Uncharacterized protein n=1 Tax=Caerostris extrusa TaxID=172846 RepID=A0AAV4NH65_CAEEX|nr:hypothetical protein CEXT_507681 [Caerostris extrusa]